MRRDARAEISLPNFFPAFGVEGIQDARNAAKEDAIPRDGGTAAPHKLGAGKPALKRPVQPPSLHIKAKQFIPYGHHIGILTRAYDVRCRPAIARDGARDRVFPDDLPGCPLESVN